MSNALKRKNSWDSSHSISSPRILGIPQTPYNFTIPFSPTTNYRAKFSHPNFKQFMLHMA